MKTLAKLFIVLFSVTLMAGSLHAQKQDYSKYEGYVEFGDLSGFDTGKNVTEVLIEEHLLKMVAKLSKNEDPELEELLSGLKLVRVHTFDVNAENSEELLDRINEVNNSLNGTGWDRIVRTRSSEETANVYIKTKNSDEILGLVVTVFDSSGEAVLLNIVGEINLDSITKLSDKFDIPSLHNLNGYNHKNHDGDKDKENEKEQ